MRSCFQVHMPAAGRAQHDEEEDACTQDWPAVPRGATDRGELLHTQPRREHRAQGCNRRAQGAGVQQESTGRRGATGEAQGAGVQQERWCCGVADARAGRCQRARMGVPARSWLESSGDFSPQEVLVRCMASEGDCPTREHVQRSASVEVPAGCLPPARLRAGPRLSALPQGGARGPEARERAHVCVGRRQAVRLRLL